jgi:hypothetical protein
VDEVETAGNLARILNGGNMKTPSTGKLFRGHVLADVDAELAGPVASLLQAAVRYAGDPEDPNLSALLSIRAGELAAKVAFLRRVNGVDAAGLAAAGAMQEAGRLINAAVRYYSYVKAGRGRAAPKSLTRVQAAAVALANGRRGG